MSEDAASCVQPVIPGLESYCPPAPSDSQRRLALNEARAKATEELYQASGRTDPAHPMHATFTGLWEELCLATGRALLEHALLNPNEVRISARPGQTAVTSTEAPSHLSLERARAIRSQAHADAAESIRLQREAKRLRARYFRGLAALHDGPGQNAFALLGADA